MGKPPFSGLATGREYHDFLKAGFAGNALTREFLQASRRARHLWMGAGLVILLLLGGVTWMWQKGYNVEQALLKVQSLVVSIHVPPEMVSIPDGTFRQGDVEKLGEAWRNPVREVSIKAFAMGKHEVTFEEYDRFTIATNRRFPMIKGGGVGSDPSSMSRGKMPRRMRPGYPRRLANSIGCPRNPNGNMPRAVGTNRRPGRAHQMKPNFRSMRSMWQTQEIARPRWEQTAQ